MLYIVPTPLGNLEDITSRAARILREVRAILCEDTRRTHALLSHFGIHTPILHYDDRNARTLHQSLDRLKAGEDLALVSDSGTPVISDPGLNIVSLARRQGIAVTSLPGPCAVSAAVAGSGLPGDSFIFLGFLPRSPARRRRALKDAASLGKTIVVYESPERIIDLLDVATEILGADRQAAIAREISKKYEEWLSGTLRDVRRQLGEKPSMRGEFVVVLHPKSAPHLHAKEPLHAR
ncbi:MAG: 16S rRNA (cytidine(1402)-2'-O)-methyltransferase [Elusimicrobia bacterium]|nr:16S rRNA (cytidine(1402)-2'-O)-methyltransferase [Elusimicrobiota bacterium]